MVCPVVRGEVSFVRLTEANMPTPATASVTKKRLADIVAPLCNEADVTAPSPELSLLR